MKILIIGAKGTLGRELARVFSSGHEVTAWDREEVDITNQEDLRLKIYDLRPELLINSAAYTDVDGSEINQDLANAINGSGVGELAKVAKGLDIPIVHFSTEYIFDGQKQEGYKEDDQPNPISAYGKSKYLGEVELQRNTEKFFLIRLSRLFGTSPQPSPQSGEGVAQRKTSFVQIMLDLAKTKSEIEVVDEELSSPTYAHDLAERTRFIVDNKKPFGIYHCANDGACTWYGFAKEIFKISGINVKLLPVPASRFPRPAVRPKYGVLLNTKLPTMRSWAQALEEFLKSQTQNPKS